MSLPLHFHRQAGTTFFVGFLGVIVCPVCHKRVPLADFLGVMNSHYYPMASSWTPPVPGEPRQQVLKDDNVISNCTIWIFIS